jgi:hypothetical protein
MYSEPVPRILTSTLFALALLSSTPTLATVVVPADIDELARAASTVLRGRVASVDARETPGRKVERLVTVDVDRYYKGNMGERVTFRVPGGTLGRYRTVLVGAPGYVVGEEVVLFLNTHGPSMPYVLGLSQGTFRVVAHPVSGTRVVVPVALERPEHHTRRVVRGDGERAPLPLDRFESMLGRALARGAR